MSSSVFFNLPGEISNRVIAYGKFCAGQIEKGWHLLISMDPWFSTGLFLVGAMLTIYRLNALERKGLEGTVLGTLVMPYASGFPNLVFAFALARQGGNGAVVVENCIVNNVTNLTLLIGLPALVWTLDLFPSRSARGTRKPASKLQRLNTLSLLLTLVAVLFFTGALWTLGRDGSLDLHDGLMLVGIFLFWQVLHIFDVLKYNIHQRRSLPWTVFIDMALIVVLGAGIFYSIDHLVAFIMELGPGFILYDQLGLISGCIMVLPNAVLAAYYAWARRGDIVYSSQVGDGHICIPMCIGLFTLFSTIDLPEKTTTGILVILAATSIHLFCVGILGKLPRTIGALFTLAYAVFLFTGLFQ